MMEQRVNELDKKLLTLESNIGSQSKEVDNRINVNDSKVSDSFQQEMEENTLKEFCDQELRKKRLVFIGVPKDVDGETFVQKLSDELNLDIDTGKIQKTFRIKARNISGGKTLPLNVEFRNESDKLKYLKSTRKKLEELSDNHKFHAVKVFPDRTYKQRKKLAALKQEMNCRNDDLKASNVISQKWIIRNMVLTMTSSLGEQRDAV